MKLLAASVAVLVTTALAASAFSEVANVRMVNAAEEAAESDPFFERLIAKEQCKDVEATEAEWRCGLIGRVFPQCSPPVRIIRRFGESGYCGNERPQLDVDVPLPGVISVAIEFLWVKPGRDQLTLRRLGDSLPVAKCYARKPDRSGDVTINAYLMGAKGGVVVGREGFDENVTDCIADALDHELRRHHFVSAHASIVVTSTLR